MCAGSQVLPGYSEIFWTPREARVIENMIGAVLGRMSHTGLGAYI